jgi:nucleotide-binding universal stress UspA family protein
MSAPLTRPRKFFVAVDANSSSIDALNETVRLRHAEDFINVTHFVDTGKEPVDVADTPSRRLLERFELFLTPRIGKSHWNVEYTVLPPDTTVRAGIVHAVNSGGYDFLVAGTGFSRRFRCSLVMIAGVLCEPLQDTTIHVHQMSIQASCTAQRTRVSAGPWVPCLFNPSVSVSPFRFLWFAAQHAHIVLVKERLPDDLPLVFVVGVDGSQSSRTGLDVAMYLSRGRGTVHVVHVYDGEIESSLPDRFKHDRIAVDYAALLSSGKPEYDHVKYTQISRSRGAPLADSLIDYCESVSGTHLFVGVDGLTAYRRGQEVIGSVADRCAKLAKCPVVLVHHELPAEAKFE